jgi:hypothetical protein
MSVPQQRRSTDVSVECGPAGLRQIDVPAAARASNTLPRVDYADSFLVAVMSLVPVNAANRPAPVSRTRW